MEEKIFARSIPYTREEAEALHGKWFKNIVAFWGLPVGSRGLVAGWEDMTGKGDCDVIIIWELPPERRSEPPYKDWFTKGEMEESMREEPPVEVVSKPEIPDEI